MNNEKKKIYIKQKKRLPTQYQFFIHQFSEACQRNGFDSKPDIIPSYKFFVRSVCRRTLLCLYKIAHKCFPNLLKRKKKAILIGAAGNTMIDSFFPYYFNYEIVPFLWDVWPIYWDQMYEQLRLFECKTVFVTVKKMSEKLRNDLGINAFYIPEGIDTTVYNRGVPLKDRKFDVLEIGRQYKKYHDVLQGLSLSKTITLNSSSIDVNGNLIDSKLQFETAEEMYAALPQYRVMVNFPQSLTNPAKAGDLETLTQRYWEAMLSGCLIIGMCPQELIDLIGYNPVIEVSWDNAQQQLLDILENIADYQSLVDKNYNTAQALASWEARMPTILNDLHEAGYFE